jgi:hypothetical protein
MLGTFVTGYKHFTDRDITGKIISILDEYSYDKYEFVFPSSVGYLIPEKDSNYSQIVFKSFVKNGYAGLWLSRTHPDRLSLQEKTSRNAEVWWITDTGSGERVVPPRPEYVKRKIENFLEKNKDKRCIILLDGLEYLITHGRDSFDSTLTLMNILSDILAESNAILIAPVHPGTLSPERFNLLSKSMKQFVPSDKNSSSAI